MSTTRKLMRRLAAITLYMVSVWHAFYTWRAISVCFDRPEVMPQYLAFTVISILIAFVAGRYGYRFMTASASQPSNTSGVADEVRS